MMTPDAQRTALEWRAAYQLWAATYRTTGQNPLTQLVDEAVRSVLPPWSGHDVLDVGCGLGRWAARAAADGARLVVGVDGVHAMLAAGRSRRDASSAPSNWHRGVATMSALPFQDASFDVLLCSLALSHARAALGPLAEMARVLRRDGALVLADIHPTAAERGWRRTFRDARGERREVSWHAHPLETLRAHLSAVGLAEQVFQERTLARPDTSVAWPTGDQHHGRVPAVFALTAIRVDPAGTMPIY